MSQKKKSHQKVSHQKTSHPKPSQQTKKQTFNPTLLWAGLGLLAVVLAGVFLFRPGNSASAEALPREVSVSEAASLREDGAFILDVREPDEWVESHIPGATLIPAWRTGLPRGRGPAGPGSGGRVPLRQPQSAGTRHPARGWVRAGHQHGGRRQSMESRRV